MSRKIVSLLLAIVMTASMLTGCGKKAASDETGTSNDTYTEEEALTDEVVDAEYDSDGAYQESMEDGSADLENSRQSEENKYKSEAAEADVYNSADSSAMKESVAEDYAVPRYADDYVPYSGEEYSNTEENPFYSVKENPLSTFSATGLQYVPCGLNCTAFPDSNISSIFCSCISFSIPVLFSETPHTQTPLLPSIEIQPLR